MTTREQRERDLVAYYDNEAGARRDRGLDAERERRRASYVDLLVREDRSRVLEVGCGPGRDGVALARAGLAYTGVDLSPAAVTEARAAGLDARAASVLDLPFADATFDAGWTMSTLLHVAHEDAERALAELVRVLRPGAPLAVGLWGSQTDGEHWHDDGDGFGPPRFFASWSDESLRRLLSGHGALEEWATWGDEGPVHYQWAVLRTR